MRGLAMIRRAALLAAALLVRQAAAADDLSLHLSLDATAGRRLVETAPTATTPQEEALNASVGETVVFGPFVSAPAAAGAGIAAGPLAFAVYLATGAAGMPGCARVGIVLDKLSAQGSAATLAASTVDTGLVPKAMLVDPIAGSAPVPADAAARAIAPGDRLALTITVTNRCTDGAHNVRLLYDAGTRPSRIAFADDCPDVDDPDQLDRDGDGFGDACDVCPATPDATQGDRDGDGVGDACDACPDEPGKPGSDAGCPCGPAGCDDGDPCTVDACDAAAGCLHEKLAALSLVGCRLAFVGDLLRRDPDVAPALTTTSSPVRRALAKAGRSLVRARRAQRHGMGGYDRRAADLAHWIDVFVTRLSAAAAAGRLPSALESRLVALATEARSAVPAP